MKTITRRIQALEQKVPETLPRVVLVGTEDGRPANATCNGETITPKPGEALADFEDRAETHFKANHVITICAGGGGPLFRSRGEDDKTLSAATERDAKAFHEKIERMAERMEADNV